MENRAWAVPQEWRRVLRARDVEDGERNERLDERERGVEGADICRITERRLDGGGSGDFHGKAERHMKELKATSRMGIALGFGDIGPDIRAR